MIDREQTKDFPTFCTALNLAERGNAHVRNQLLDNGRAASEHMDKLLAHAERMVGAVPELLKQYTDSELRTLVACEEASMISTLRAMAAMPTAADNPSLACVASV